MMNLSVKMFTIFNKTIWRDELEFELCEAEMQKRANKKKYLAKKGK